MSDTVNKRYISAETFLNELITELNQPIDWVETSQGDGNFPTRYRTATVLINKKPRKFVVRFSIGDFYISVDDKQVCQTKHNDNVEFLVRGVILQLKFS